MGPAKEFLASLAKISKLTFQVWDIQEGLVFSSNSDQYLAPPLQELEDFSAQIIHGAKFHHAQSNGGEGLFGVPIVEGDQVVGCLIAFDGNSHGQPQEKITGEAGSSGVAEMEKFLTQLATLLQDRLTTQLEMEQMAEELTDNNQKAIFNRIADEEHKHWVTMENVIQFLDKPGNWLEDAEWNNLEDY